MEDTSHKEDIYIIFAGPLSNLLLFLLGYLLIGHVDTGLLFDFLLHFQQSKSLFGLTYSNFPGWWSNI
jgi:uncharacterized membrane-anchored protein YitT (DUF2179 family)